MYATSDNFNRRIRQSGRRKTVVDVYYDGHLAASGLAVSGGNIRVDIDGDIRRSGDITIADPGLVPTFTADVLSPLGAEVAVRQGIVFPDGTEELVPLGVFRLDLTSWSDAAGAIPAIQLYDRAKAVGEQINNPISRAGWLASEVIKEFIEFFYPSLAPLDGDSVFGPGLTDYRLPGGQVWDSGTYWSVCQELARSMGGDLYFDVIGQPRVTRRVDLYSYTPATEALVVVDVGPEGVLVDAQHTWSREGVYNAVSVVGAVTADETPPSALVTNNDPLSPLRWGGPFGKATLQVNDPTLSTVETCLTRAVTELRRFTGASYSIDYSAVPNPAIDVGDLALFKYLDGHQEVHVISTLGIPLGAGSYGGTSKGMSLDR